jgi:hypothetical protein
MGGAGGDESSEEEEAKIMTPYNSITRGVFMIFAPLTNRGFFKRL